ncbi:MAG: helix-hairpin-helix domain-containing protein [Oscillospiraceae bacterium]|jgi:competence protein ComEA|nr:helix-hairpin-helix domain-containing protein [Oscillospiraceae bacterium]
MKSKRRKPELLVAAVGLLMAAGLLFWVGASEQTAKAPAGGTQTAAAAERQGYEAAVADPFAQQTAADSQVQTPPANAPATEASLPGETAPEATIPNAPTLPPTKNAAQPASPVQVRLNSATAEQLQTLKGIGPAKAQAILEYRTAHGGFTDVMQLLEVKGIGQATLANILPYVVLD